MLHFVSHFSCDYNEILMLISGSPVWKPRDAFAPGAGSTFGAGAGGAGQRGESLTLPRAGKPSGREDHFLVYEEYGGNIYMSSKKDTGSTKTLHY